MRTNNCCEILLIAVAIAGSCLLGCSAVPKALITDVESFTVARTLYENGGTETEYEDAAFMDSIGHDMVEGLFEALSGKSVTLPPTKPETLRQHKTVWPDPEVLHNRRKTTAKYSLQGFMFDSTHCRDTIKFHVPQSGETILSVKCEKKEMQLFDIIKWFLPYKRDHGREQMLMTGTARQLQADHSAQIEWLGKWRPDPNDR